jgi:TonB family protein
MRLILIFFLVLPTSFYGQERRFFTRHFQTMVNEKTENERKYTFEENWTIIEDSMGAHLQVKGIIYGLTQLDKVNEFTWYCRSLGEEMNYRDYFKNIKGVFDFYEKGKIVKQVIIKNKKVKYAQVWDSDGQELLSSGTGVNNYRSGDEDVYESYKDSTLVVCYGIRTEKRDTIYRTYDKLASPKEGLSNFYQNLVRNLKYPGVARLAGKEGRVYIQFIVDEKGNLTEFKALSKEGFNLEAKAIKRLEKFPKWNPTVFNNRSVKSKFVLPINFKLTD